MFHLRSILLAAVLGLAAPALAQQPATDVDGAADPPGLPRIAGAVIIGYDQSGYDEFTYPTGKLTSDGPETAVTIEGPRTRVLYIAPVDRSALEVVRNYQAELTEQGYTPVYDCGSDRCGEAKYMARMLYKTTPLQNSGQLSDMAFAFPRADQRYLVMANAQTGTTVSVYAAYETFGHFERTSGKVLVLLDVVEGKPLQRKMEFVTAAAMASDLGTLGRVSLYGILFDYDSDKLRPESDPTLAEIVTLMGADPAMTLFVVGHTDITGSYDYNLDLSRRRAASVVAALTARYGISPTRLSSAGVGPLAPVAENLTEDGRAKNRRVELVRR